MFTHQAENSRTNYHYNSFIYTNTEWKPHFHRSFELITVLEGTLTLQINDRSFLVHLSGSVSFRRILFPILRTLSRADRGRMPFSHFRRIPRLFFTEK